jgi:protein gp37
MRMAARLEAMGVQKYVGLTRKSGDRRVWTGKIHLDETALAIPTTWKSPRKIFVNSMSDLFHEDVDVHFIERVWQTMSVSRRHTFQILTKRPKLMASILKDTRRFEVLSNVWLGVSVEDSKVIDRLDSLRETPAKIRFASFEPLIGSVKTADLSGINWAIVGGESGPHARMMNEQWVNEIYKLCKENHTAFFFKQWGGKNKKQAGRSYRGRLWDALPELRM